MLVDRGDQRFLVLVEDGAPFLLRFQIDEVLGIEKTGGVGAIVGPARLADHLRHLRERSHHDARLVGEVDARGGAFAGGQRSAHPDGAFIQMGQKLRADGPAEGEIDRDEEEDRQRSRTSMFRCTIAARTAVR